MTARPAKVRTRDGSRRPVGARVVVLGGGNGISAVLRGIERRRRSGKPLHVTAIVATADDGGSSGRLRDERGGLPPGDLRNCLLALAPENAAGFARVFAHRYEGSGDLAGHSLGNLILAALAEQENSYLRAVELAAEMLGAGGRVLPVSLQSVRLEAEARDGSRISGESRIGKAHCAVSKVWLDPPHVEPCPGVTEAIRSADLLVLGPGSLFTSLLAVLLIPGVQAAVRASRGRRVLVANLMTQPGETLGMNLTDHLEALDRHVGPELVQDVLADGSGPDPDRVRPYEEQGAEPLSPILTAPRTERLVVRDLVTTSGKIRHDPDSLAEALLELLQEAPRTARNAEPTRCAS